MKKFLSIALCMTLLCVIVASVNLPAYAANAIDVEKDVQLTITYEKNGKAISGAKFTFYKVADVDAYSRMTLVSRFSEYPIAFDDLKQHDWDVLATTLKGYVWSDSLTADICSETDAAGNMQTVLKPGLYLVVGYPRTIGNTTYYVAPFMLSLPSSDVEESNWDYAVTAYPKADGEKVPSNNPDSKLVSRKVLKVWDDTEKESNRPQEITVHLLCDSKVYDTVKLNAENNWCYTWDNLDRNHEWLVTEDAVSGYTQTVTQEGITFTVKNTVKPENPADPVESSNPVKPSDPVGPVNSSLLQTGLLWWPVYILVVAGLLCVVIGLVCRNNSKSE